MTFLGRWRHRWRLLRALRLYRRAARLQELSWRAEDEARRLVAAMRPTIAGRRHGFG